MQTTPSAPAEVGHHPSPSTRPTVGRVLLAWLKIQLGAELFGMPGYRLTLRGRTPDGFLAAPHDVRSAKAATGRAMLSGRFALADARMSVQGSGDPWNRPSPTRAFALQLHRFAWLPPLMTQGEDGAKEALRLFLLWQKTFRNWTPFAWSPAVLPRRLIQLSGFARKLAAQGTPEDSLIMAQSMSEQGRHLLRLHNDPATQATRAVALVILGCVLAGRVGDGFRRKGLKRLPAALKRTVLADGSHASRSPQAALELLYDLMMLEDALAQRSQPVPASVEQAIQLLSRFVRVMSHPDGSLCAFQGAESLPEDRIAPALVHTDNRADARAAALPMALEQGRYHRLLGRSLSVYVDAGEARADAFGVAACDQPMNFEVSGGRDKLIVSPGWSPLQADRQAFRVIGAANGLSLGEDVILAPVSGRFGDLLDHALEGPRYKVRSRRVEAGESGALLELEHDGWKPKYGMRHERRLYVDVQRDELRGEDRLTPIESRKDMPVAAPFAIRFLLHPEVQASLARDRKSILLRGPGGRGWWLRHDARDVTLEENGVVFEGASGRRTTMIALRGTCRLDAPTRVRWKLSPAES
ncbi:heparinase II/III family protein [Asticcacaulis sp. EMRT-3]|uniref:heparinase II/III family protein n=1 Tax=Asticcacaulis sp. EMRT-3 TaxID=3040349 RepID=UPI0024AEE8C8|nr:heparinase II/III family protein [Asticcacaulis sp. EMRT-3]MDI7775850.1 heparinase II/III family protein [Asticcacaulis sp. EMRT-3]